MTVHDEAYLPWAECRETHVSAVFFAGDRVLKMKKPVHTEFLDFTSLPARVAACEAEVALNRRLSPDIYLGVVHIGLHDAGQGEPVVVMRRLRDEDQLKHRIAVGEVGLRDEIREVARQLAVFHGECDVHGELNSPGGWKAIQAAWGHECDELDLLGDSVATADVRGAIRRHGCQYLEGRAPLFDARLKNGQVRDGHGDLRCEHVYLTDDGPRIIDCVEFDPSLRIADVLSDIAFLAMDLERLGADGLASALLSDYRELGADSYPESLLDFYVAYRAIVRAKVRAIRSDQTGTVDPEVSRLIELAHTHLQRAVPVMLCIGGLPGTGKSTLSEAFAASDGAIHISTDEIRHGLHPLEVSDLQTNAWEGGPYSSAATVDVYAELAGRAETALSEGYSVVLDASWRDATQRERAHSVARSCGATVVDIKCEIDERTAYRRLAGTRGGYSQAGTHTREAMKRAFDPWPAALVVATDREISDTVAALRQLVSVVVEAHRDFPAVAAS